MDKGQKRAFDIDGDGHAIARVIVYAACSRNKNIRRGSRASLRKGSKRR
jgi:hypothetical protein